MGKQIHPNRCDKKLDVTIEIGLEVGAKRSFMRGDV